MGVLFGGRGSEVPAGTAAVAAGVDEVEVAEVVEHSAGLAVGQPEFVGEVSSGAGTVGERGEGAGLGVVKGDAGAVGVAVVPGSVEGHCHGCWCGVKAGWCEPGGGAEPDHAQGARAELVDDAAPVERAEDQWVPGV